MHDFGHLGGYHKHSVRLFLYLDRGPSLLNEACQLRLSSDAGNSNSWVKPREAQLSHSIYHNLSGNNLILQIPGFKFTPQSRDFDHRLLQYLWPATCLHGQFYQSCVQEQVIRINQSYIYRSSKDPAQRCSCARAQLPKPRMPQMKPRLPSQPAINDCLIIPSGEHPPNHGKWPLKQLDLPINSMIIVHCCIAVHQRINIGRIWSIA